MDAQTLIPWLNADPLLTTAEAEQFAAAAIADPSDSTAVPVLPRTTSNARPGKIVGNLGNGLRPRPMLMFPTRRPA